jgi:hypothetical protein
MLMSQQWDSRQIGKMSYYGSEVTIGAAAQQG